MIREGTVSHGTMLSTDLAPAFLAELPAGHELQAEYDRITEAIGTLANAGIEVDTDDYLEWLDNLVQELFGALNALAPEGMYFGAHPGDGSDYGFWPVEDSE